MVGKSLMSASVTSSPTRNLHGHCMALHRSAERDHAPGILMMECSCNGVMATKAPSTRLYSPGCNRRPRMADTLLHLQMRGMACTAKSADGSNEERARTACRWRARTCTPSHENWNFHFHGLSKELKQRCFYLISVLHWQCAHK